jgi:hypothetical protein
MVVSFRWCLAPGGRSRKVAADALADSWKSAAPAPKAARRIAAANQSGANCSVRQRACAFAVNVLKAYRDSHPSPGSATRTVTADSVVACPDYGEQCVGPPVVLNCAIDDNGTWVTCSDGGVAQVLLF